MQALAVGDIAQAHVDKGSNVIIPMPAPLKGLLIIGQKSITYKTADTSLNAPLNERVIRVSLLAHKLKLSTLIPRSFCSTKNLLQLLLLMSKCASVFHVQGIISSPINNIETDVCPESDRFSAFIVLRVDY